MNEIKTTGFAALSEQETMAIDGGSIWTDIMIGAIKFAVWTATHPVILRPLSV